MKVISSLLLLLSIFLTSVQCNLTNMVYHIPEGESRDEIFLRVIDGIRNNVNAGQECKDQVEMLEEGNLLIYMADAWSKPYPGLLYASKKDMGNFDECINIDYSNAKGRVLGKYCFPGLIIPTSLDISLETLLLWGICVPDKCTAEDIGLPLAINDQICTNKLDNTKLDAGAIVTIVIIFLVIALMIGQTAFDVVLYLQEKKCKNPILVAFSVFSNGKRLFKVTKGGGEQILCFNGMKAISMVWIIAAHSAAPWEALPTSYHYAYKNWINSRSSQYLQSAKFGVDTFFFISGFLLAYQYFKSEVKKPIVRQAMNVPIMIVHRYLRLTPAVLILFLYVTYLARFVGEGPGFNIGQSSFIKPCKKYWWTFFLYIQNYHNPKDLCIIATWYLSADMQLFLFAIPITILLAYVYKSSYKLTMMILAGLNLVFLVFPFFTKLYLSRNFDPTLELEYDSHSRLIGYFIGIMFGLYVRHERTKLKKVHQKLNLLIWLVVLVVMYVLTHVAFSATLSGEYVKKAITISFVRPLWCLGLCWIVYSCLVGQGGVVNWFLSSSAMQFGGKISYCLYLIHGPVISTFLLQTRTQNYFSDYVLFNYFCGHFIMSVMVATFWSLAFEIPFMIVEKVLLGGGGRARHPRASAAPHPPETKRTSTDHLHGNHEIHRKSSTEKY